jgi:hypothetical protein
MTLERFWHELSTWSQATFGLDVERGPQEPLKHLAKGSPRGYGQAE